VTDLVPGKKNVLHQMLVNTASLRLFYFKLFLKESSI